MSSHTITSTEEEPRMEVIILSEIRDAEKKADDIVEKAKREKERIVHESRASSSSMIPSKEEEIKKLQEKKLIDFRDKSKLIIEEKIAEGKLEAKQLKSKSEKNIAKAVEFAIKKFEEMI